MNEIAVSPVPPGSDLLDRVWQLYRKNSGTLGFLPRGAFDEFAQAGCMASATSGPELVGYTAWRRSRREAIIVHLCVAEAFRGGAGSDCLLKYIFEQCRDDAVIRLRCRKDYASANKLWPRHGFAADREVAGRGADSAPLLEWRRINQDDAPLLSAIRASSKASYVVALDANVFFDLMDPASVHRHESQVLLADWLPDVNVCVTRELCNEISRQANLQRRKEANVFRGRFDELWGPADSLAGAVETISRVLPDPVSESDESDRRQLAHAWLGGAGYFATRDEALLDHRTDLHAITGMRILRPSEVVAAVRGDFPGRDYAPVRLHGTKIVRKAATEADLLPFQNFASREPKSAWLAGIRAALVAKNRCAVEVIGEAGHSPRVAIAVEELAPTALHIRFLRALSGPLTGTLLRRALADVVESARASAWTSITIDDPGEGEVRDALVDLGFESASDRRWTRHSLFALSDIEGVRWQIQSRIPSASEAANLSASELEARYWPVKVTGSGIPCFIVPIQSYWAAALFDRDLAARELFDVPLRPALALENVYFSASRVSIPAGSRILWYVSRDVGAVRAASTCLGTATGPATLLSRQHHHLGVYGWREILDAAGGDENRGLRAYRFARTELMIRPLAWNRLKELIVKHTGTRNTLVSPLKVPEALFVDVYREGMGLQA